MIKINPYLAGAAILVGLSALSARADSVKTRIGDLSFDVGYPSSKTAERLYDEMDFQRATQGYLWALPAVGFHALHLAHLNSFGAPDGSVVLYQNLDDKAGMLTPNITTLYAFSFWDLAASGPLVIEVPAGMTAGGVLDIWQRPMTDMGQTGPDQGQGAKYLILPPGAQDINPEGFIVVHSPTNQIWFGSRGLDPDKAVAEATIRKHRLYAWANRDAPPETAFIPVAGRKWQSAQPTDIKYWQYLSDLFANEPIEDRDRMMFAMLRPLGLVPGQPFAPDERQSAILTEAAQMGDLMARTIAYDKRFTDGTVYDGKHWEYANLVELDQEASGYTQLDERGSWFYEAIGNSAGMQGRILGFGQVYLETSKDSAGNWLDGGKTYRMRVEPSPPVRQFWSVTLYDNLSRGPVITTAGSADLSSRKPDLVTNADGSVDVFFGPEKPEGATNFIQTNPGQGWFPYFRFYGPTEAYFDKSWQLNDIEELVR
ncbi:MAG: DUF1254 domain-containing protein [Alphaproteobacteria bacterium]